MKYLYLLFALLFTISCGRPVESCDSSLCDLSTISQDLRCEFCEPSPTPIKPTWQPIYSPTYKPEVSEWSIYTCPANNYEKITNHKSVVIGFGGYQAPCLFEAVPLEVHTYSPRTKVRITVTQRGGHSNITDIPFYTHLFVAYDVVPLSVDLLQLMPFVPGGDYQASYTFELPVGADTLNLVLGVDPAYITGVFTPADQPLVELKTVRVEVLK